MVTAATTAGNSSKKAIAVNSENNWQPDRRQNDITGRQKRADGKVGRADGQTGRVRKSRWADGQACARAVVASAWASARAPSPSLLLLLWPRAGPHAPTPRTLGYQPRAGCWDEGAAVRHGVDREVLQH